MKKKTPTKSWVKAAVVAAKILSSDVTLRLVMSFTLYTYFGNYMHPFQNERNTNYRRKKDQFISRLSVEWHKRTHNEYPQ